MRPWQCQQLLGRTFSHISARDAAAAIVVDLVMGSVAIWPAATLSNPSRPHLA